MIPGPSEPYPEAVTALVKPIYPHYGDDFLELYNSLVDNLRSLFGTRKYVHLYAGTATAAMEMGILSILDEGDKVVFVNKGFFVDRFRRIADIHGAETHQVAPDMYGLRVDIEELAYTIDVLRPKAVVLVHSETSTGVLEDIEAISKIIPEDTYFIVDYVSSFGALRLRSDDWRVDYAVGYSSKALGAVNGLTPFMVSERLWSEMDPKKRRAKAFTIDLSVYRWYVDNWEKHPYPTSISPHLLNAMLAATDRVLDEGLDRVEDRHYRVSRLVWEWVDRHGFEPLPEEGAKTPTVSVFKIPDEFDSAAISSYLTKKYGIYISTTWLIGVNGLRIGHMGNTAHPNYVIPTLHALEEAFKKVR